MAYGNICEEELKNKVAQDYFADYDTTRIIGKIDFCVAVPDKDPALFETESLLWAESKAGTAKDIYESFVQLILTVGRARTFDSSLPPAFLGAFDAEKIAFLPYIQVLDVFYQNDFNWNVAPSDHATKEFRQLYDLVKDQIENNVLLYRFGSDDKELRNFIRKNFVVGKSSISKIRINKNNFTHIYQKWRVEVKPSIAVDWGIAQKEGLIDADFYLADILSKDNIPLKNKLFVLLRSDHYVYNIQRKATGAFSFETVEFNDQQVAHTQFWNRYDRPPKREYWDYIVERRDLLVPTDVRERKGSFFTPQKWVELSQQYIAEELGEDWQDEYYVWDCAAGTGNLLAGLTNKYNLWASTLDPQDVKAMHDLIDTGSLHLLEGHVFQFDFLNDSFDKLPQGLREIIEDDTRRRKLVIYINPPYAEASNARTVVNTGTNRSQLAKNTRVYKTYFNEYGAAVRELSAQFLIRICHELSDVLITHFSTLKILQASNFREFRARFQAKISQLFLVPANTFDNVKGQFPIGFFIWDTSCHESFESIVADVYNAHAEFMATKNIYSFSNYQLIIDWLRGYYDKSNKIVGYLRMVGTDVQNYRGIFVTNNLSENDIKKRLYTRITKNNVCEMCIYYTVRHCIEPTWLNDRDQFLYPNDGWKNDPEFQADCLAFALFSNNIQSQYGTNHWIPFTEAEVEARDRFASHFMTDYLAGKIGTDDPGQSTEPELFAPVGTADSISKTGPKPIVFSSAAQAVMDAGRELWRYYHARPDSNPNAALYDIREYFQGRNEKGKMNNDSPDAVYTQLIKNLRDRLKRLAEVIEPKVYEYGFLKK